MQNALKNSAWRATVFMPTFPDSGSLQTLFRCCVSANGVVALCLCVCQFVSTVWSTNKMKAYEHSACECGRAYEHVFECCTTGTKRQTGGQTPKVGWTDTATTTHYAQSHPLHAPDDAQALESCAYKAPVCICVYYNTETGRRSSATAYQNKPERQNMNHLSSSTQKTATNPTALTEGTPDRPHGCCKGCHVKPCNIQLKKAAQETRANSQMRAR
jgi:hypothetical protein